MTLPVPGDVVSPPDEQNPYGFSITKRLVIPAAEKLLYRKHSTFGEEQITLVDYMGGDQEVERVATAGHMSAIFPEKPDRPDFLAHLEAKGIEVPFKAVQLKFQIQCSIADALHFVYAKQASVNEYSGRYSVMIDSSFLPTAEYLASRMKGLAPQTAADNAQKAAELIAEGRTLSYAAYKILVSADIDLAREVARAPLELNNDTVFFWKMELDDLCNFIADKRDLKGREVNGREVNGGGVKGRDVNRERRPSLYAYLDVMEQAARAIAPESTNVLLGTQSCRELSLTMPKDEDVIDPTPLPAPWKPAETRRVTVPELEKILFIRHHYLDHGAVQAVSYLGDNRGPVESARISYGEGTKRLSEDRHLLRYLIRHHHTTPFEHVELAVEGKTPLFIDPRQAGRHRTLDRHCFLGEQLLGSQYFLPPNGELKYQDRKNRQGRGKEMDEESKEIVLRSMRESYGRETSLIHQLRELNVAEEDLRGIKGVGFYTFNWRTGDLQNWMHFLGLRLDAHAQQEIREFAGICARSVEAQAPDVMEALRDYRLNAVSLTARDLPAFAALIDQEKLQQNIDSVDFYQQFGLTKTEKVESSEGQQPALSREGEELRQKLRRLLTADTTKP